MNTLHYFGSTLSLSPHAAAMKNKTRRAEKAFMILIGDKIILFEVLFVKFFQTHFWNKNNSCCILLSTLISYWRWSSVFEVDSGGSSSAAQHPSLEMELG